MEGNDRVRINTYHLVGLIRTRTAVELPYHKMFLSENDAKEDMENFGDGVLTNLEIKKVIIEAEKADETDSDVALDNPPCPECDSRMILQEGCQFCPNCFFSRCE